jgi:hypothetical protein
MRRSAGDHSRAPTKYNDLTSSVAQWRDTFEVAQLWVRDCARERWPGHPTNDGVWAMSATSWWHGGRS